MRNLIIEVVVAARLQRDTPRGILTSLKGIEAESSKIGITFKILEARGPDGKGTGKYESTSLMGTDMKKMLRLLPGIKSVIVCLYTLIYSK